MATARRLNGPISDGLLKALDELAYEDLSAEHFGRVTRTLGREMARTYLKTPNLPKRFHVVAAVEDFDNFAAGVMMELERAGNVVSYSCLWPQREIMRVEPLREICPIYQAFHQDEPTGGYRLVFAVSNIGTAARIKSCLVHTVIDQGLNRSDLVDVLAGSCHADIESRLSSALPRLLAGRIRLHSPAIDFEFDLDGFTIPGIGGNPTFLAGYRSNRQREYSLPDRVSNDFGLSARGFEF
ncbi:hypothetical protein ACC719_11380 [Rhizobium ruizarguesonis]